MQKSFPTLVAIAAAIGSTAAMASSLPTIFLTPTPGALHPGPNCLTIEATLTGSGNPPSIYVVANLANGSVDLQTGTIEVLMSPEFKAYFSPSVYASCIPGGNVAGTISSPRWVHWPVDSSSPGDRP